MSAPAITIPNLSPATGLPLRNLDDLQTLYENGRGFLLACPADESYAAMNEAGAKRHLRIKGLSNSSLMRGGVTEVDETLQRIQTEKKVAFSGAIAGKRRGLYEIQGQKILVTEEFKLVAPKDGRDWPTTRELLERARSTRTGPIPSFLTFWHG